MNSLKPIIFIFFVFAYSFLVNSIQNDTDAKLDPDDPCFIFSHTTQVQLTISPHFIRATSEDKQNVTLVTQMSFDRIYMIEKIISHWDGPISMVVYLSHAQVDSFKSQLHKLNIRNNIGIHLVYYDKSILYPINRLRNIALEYASTHYVYNVDADFVPAKDAYSTLEELFSIKKYNLTKKGLVIPAFSEVGKQHPIPKNKKELLKSWDNGFVKPSTNSHKATDYDKWRNASEIYGVNWENGYEPYLVVERKSLPLFDEKFNGYGMNKVVFCTELHYLGYEFFVHSDLFAVHMHHPPSEERMNQNNDPNYSKCQQLRRSEFDKEMNKFKEY